MLRALAVSLLLVVVAGLLYGVALVQPRFLGDGFGSACNTGPESTRERARERENSVIGQEIVYWPPGLECRTQRGRRQTTETKELAFAEPAIVGLVGSTLVVMAAGAFAATRRRFD